MLRFTPTAWAKLHFFCHHGDTEIGGFGVTGADDLLLIEDFQTVKQTVSEVSVNFDDLAVADYFEQQVDDGLRPEQFGRIWLHTHPGNSASPSITDEKTFARVFGGCDWALMFILARGGETYARLRFNVGPGGSVLLPVEVDYTACFDGSDHTAWEAEYDLNIMPLPVMPRTTWPDSYGRSVRERMERDARETRDSFPGEPRHPEEPEGGFDFELDPHELDREQTELLQYGGYWQ